MKLDIPSTPNNMYIQSCTFYSNDNYNKKHTCKSEGYAHRIELVTTCDNCSIQHGLWGDMQSPSEWMSGLLEVE